MQIGRCELCHKPNKELQESHLLAAGFLRRLQSDGKGNRNPYLMSLNWVGQTSKQATQPLLCTECEDRFNAGGERWVIANGYNPQEDRFPLRERIMPAKTLFSGPYGGAYDASQIPGIEIEKLVYFGPSVIWRATTRSWRIQKEHYNQLPIESKYQEELRQYLLGNASFPESAASVVYVSPSRIPPLSAGYPECHQEESHANYRFYVAGLWFLLLLGEELSDDSRKMCILRSPVHPLCLYAGGDALVHAIEYNLYLESKAT